MFCRTGGSNRGSAAYKSGALSIDLVNDRSGNILKSFLTNPFHPPADSAPPPPPPRPPRPLRLRLLPTTTASRGTRPSRGHIPAYAPHNHQHVPTSRSHRLPSPQHSTSLTAGACRGRVNSFQLPPTGQPYAKPPDTRRTLPSGSGGISSVLKPIH